MSSHGVRVRQRPHSRTLRVGRSLASLYRPGECLTHSVWDAMAAPLCLLPPSRRSTVLILGLGGGSAARIMRALAPRATIVAVEISEAVIRAATADFDIEALGLEIVVDDARRFLERDRRRFDFILDDCFVEESGKLAKPSWMPDPGIDLVTRRLKPNGLFACDTIHETSQIRRMMGGRLPHVLEVTHDDCENRILVASQLALSAIGLRRAMGAEVLLREVLPHISVRRRPDRAHAQSTGRGSRLS